MTEADDFDDFIKDQKTKLNQERYQDPPNKTDRKVWDKQQVRQAPAVRPQTPEEVGLPFSQYENQKKHLQTQRKQTEYNDSIQKPANMLGYQQSNQFRPETPEEPIVAKLGGYQDKRKKLQEERKKEYNDLLIQKPPPSIRPRHDGPITEDPHHQQQFRRTGRLDEDTGKYAATILAKEDRPSAQENKRRDKELYRDFLVKQKEEQQYSHRGGMVKPYSKHEAADADDFAVKARDKNEDYATLPGLRNKDSAELRKMHERNKEYNDWLHSKKNQGRPRSQADQDLRLDLPEDFDRPAPRKGWATPTYDEILEKKRREENSYRKQNDPGYGQMKSSRSEGNLNRRLEHENRFRDLDREYESKKVRFRSENSFIDTGLEFSDWPSRSRVSHRPPPAPSGYDDLPPPRALPATDTRVPPATRPYSRPEPDNFATLAIGTEHRGSADQRKKEAYRRELEQQMKELKSNRDRERQDELRVNATGEYGVGSLPERQKLPENRSAPRRQDDYSPRDIVYGDQRPPARSGILDNGFDGLYKPLSQSPRGGLPPTSLGNYSYPEDDAYNYYSSQNPLDSRLPTNNRGNTRDPQLLGYDKPSVKFADSLSNPEPRRETRAANTAFPDNDDRNKVHKDAQKQYQDELKIQIEEQKMKKQKEKADKERYDLKLDEEIRNYDPFGRGGGGAPLKDNEGNIIANRTQAKAINDPSLATKTPPSVTADLRGMHQENDDPYNKPYVEQYTPPSYTATNTSPGKDPDSFARGGHGIFGAPMTDAEKMKKNRYQDELRLQMDEKKRKQDQEKLLQRQEDEKLLKKIEEDNQKMQQELEAEKNKERKKQEVAQQQQEELRRLQDDKRKEEERKRMQEDEKHQDDLRKMEEDRRRERERAREPEKSRTDSPPIPAMRSKTEPPPSPPVPARRTQSRQSRAASADVLNQLARMRQQLQSERKRVESDLKKEEDEPEVFDPRQHKPHAPSTVDVFEVARNKEPVTVRRPPSDANSKHVHDFKKLRNKGSSDSRSDFRRLFPNTPLSNEALDTQQRTLLMQQEEALNDIRQRKPYDRELTRMNPADLGLVREGSLASAALLDSESAFIGVPNGSVTPMSDGLSSRNESARSRRRHHLETPKNKSEFGSVVSLDVEGIIRRNEERERKLKSLGDDVSTASADPEEILDRFMSKQQHARPPSGQTLMDDSWLRPGTRIS